MNLPPQSMFQQLLCVSCSPVRVPSLDIDFRRYWMVSLLEYSMVQAWYSRMVRINHGQTSHKACI